MTAVPLKWTNQVVPPKNVRFILCTIENYVQAFCWCVFNPFPLFPSSFLISCRTYYSLLRSSLFHFFFPASLPPSLPLDSGSACHWEHCDRDRPPNSSGAGQQCSSALPQTPVQCQVDRPKGGGLDNLQHHSWAASSDPGCGGRWPSQASHRYLDEGVCFGVTMKFVIFLIDIQT